VIADKNSNSTLSGSLQSVICKNAWAAKEDKKEVNGLLSMEIPGYFQNVALANLPENQKHFASMTILPCYGGLTFCLFSIISGINYLSTNLLTKDNSEKRMRQN
jgi:hypothetical protein